MKPVIFHAEAETEFRAAIAYYEGQRKGLGKEFRAAVRAATQLIRQTPAAFSPWGNEGIRQFVVNRFPYSVFYMELDAVIWIAAVAHQRRRAGYWAQRTPE